MGRVNASKNCSHVQRRLQFLLNEEQKELHKLNKIQDQSLSIIEMKKNNYQMKQEAVEAIRLMNVDTVTDKREYFLEYKEKKKQELMKK